MKIWRTVSGILSIVLFVVVLFQSCAVGIGNAMAENGETSGTTGLLVAIMLLVGGIISLVVRKGNSKGGNIALIIVYALGALFGFGMSGSFGDLKIWAAWCAICAVLAIVAIITEGKRQNKETEKNN